MTPVIQCFPTILGTTFTTRKSSCLSRFSFLKSSSKQSSSSQRAVLPLSTTIRIFPQYRCVYAQHHTTGIRRISATGTDVAVEEQEAPVVDEEASAPPEEPSPSVAADKSSSAKIDANATSSREKRARPARKSEMPPIKDEDLVPGTIFTGKVRSIQPFGAFIDFGAFTDGLVHVSRLSDSFVKDVNSVVTVGQEVKVRLVEVNTETGRISLSMRENDEKTKTQQRKEGPSGNENARPPRRSPSRFNQKRDEGKKSKFVKGQDLVGTVKNLTRSGAFISLPEGEEGFLPSSEEADDGMGNIMGGSSLEIGQEINARVLRITRGQVTLTMKKEEDVAALDLKLNQGTVHTATNPFVLAFRKNKDIASFLDERERFEEAAQTPEIPGEAVETGEPELAVASSESNRSLSNSAQAVTEETGESVLAETDSNDVKIPEEAEDAKEPAETGSEILSVLEEPVPSNASIANASTSEAVDGKDESVSVETKPSEVEIPEQAEHTKQLDESVVSSIATSQNVDPSTDDSVQIPEELSSSDSVVLETDSVTAKEDVELQTPIAEKDALSSLSAAEQIVSSESEEQGTPAISNEETDETSSQESITEAKLEIDGKVDPSTDAVLSQLISPQTSTDEETGDDKTHSNAGNDEMPTPSPAAVETSSKPISNENDGSVRNDDDNVPDSNAPTGNPSNDSTHKATISPTLVKQLIEETGAGMMDCKKALSETGGDIIKAQEYLRKKGLASAEKKASRVTAEGRIGSYIHDSRIGVLIEVNCETDFVSRGEIFKELVDDLAMQVAACPQVDYVVAEDVPKELVDKEREIEMQKEDLLSKPEQIRAKIVDGRIKKRLEELALLEQPYIKNDKVLLKDWVKQTISTIGENIKVKRFVRYNLGEGLEKKSQDFAAEVAAQTAAKSSTAVKEQPATPEPQKPEDKPATVAVSAALVKQLREETGAGMMDCKKALSETGGDLEKAQEYLRKKGLSTADKKSSRLAAEGRIGSYIHDSRIGVLIEVNCETDFVGRSEKFKELVDDLAMQVAACPQVQFVSTDEVSESVIEKEKEIEMQREDILSKPENIRSKIVEGRIGKRLGELALLEQPFIKDDSILVKDLVKQTVAALGENIKVRRFARFTLCS